MSCQLYLFHPVGHGHHSEMSYRYFKIGTFADDLFHFGHLQCSVGQCYRQYHAVLLHVLEHLHHFGRVEPNPVVAERKSVSRYGQSAESVCYQFFCIGEKTRFAKFTHAENEKPVGVSLYYIGEILILISVDEFLCDHGCRNLCIIHV